MREWEEYKDYKTRVNGGYAFLVRVGQEPTPDDLNNPSGKTVVEVFGVFGDFSGKEGFDTPVAVYDDEVYKVHVGWSSGESVTADHSPHRNKWTVGNSVLVTLTGNKSGIHTRCIFIGECVYEFTTPPGDEVASYHSPVGHSCVPYPVAVGEKYVYFMLHQHQVPIEFFPPNMNWEDAYRYYYGHVNGLEPLVSRATPMIDVKEIAHRP